jgi:hypothetical protein
VIGFAGEELAVAELASGQFGVVFLLAKGSDGGLAEGKRRWSILRYLSRHLFAGNAADTKSRNTT